MDFDSASEGENYGLDSKVDSQWTPDGGYFVLFEKAGGDLYLQQFDRHDNLVYHIDSWGQIRPRIYKGKQIGFEVKASEGSFTPCDLQESDTPYFLEGHCDLRPAYEMPEAPKDDFDTDVRSLYDENLEQKASRSLARLNERRLDTATRGKDCKRQFLLKKINLGGKAKGMPERPKGNHGALGPVERDEAYMPSYVVNASMEDISKAQPSKPIVEQIPWARKRFYL